MPIATGSGCASASIVWLRPSIMCSLPFSVLSIIRKFYPIGNRLRNFSWRRWRKPLLFTPCANSNWFCRCFAFRIGKIHYHHCIVRNFQFRKFLPVYSNKQGSILWKSSYIYILFFRHRNRRRWRIIPFCPPDVGGLYRQPFFLNFRYLNRICSEWKCQVFYLSIHSGSLVIVHALRKQ